MDKIFKALSDPTRREILRRLREQPLSAGELAEGFELAKPTLSGHFKVLREAGLVDADKSGTTIMYRLNLSVLEEALLAFTQALGMGSPARPRAGKPGNARARHA